MSPTILIEGPYRFYFNSREESRMHVESQNGKAKFWLERFVTLADLRGLKKHEVNRIQAIVEQNEEMFRNEWRKHFSG